jgi:hypothetical protein
MQGTAPQAAIYRPETAVVAVGTGNESTASAISWAAIIAGAFAAAAMGLILIALGTGLGFAAVSPWSNSGASATTMTIAGAIWLLLMSAIASGIGGYLAGRLRTRWVDVHGDEVFFRDTAHGFLAWAVGTVITAAVLTSAAGALVGGTAKVAAVGAGAAVAGAGAAGMASSAVAPGRAIEGADPNAYYVDSLFRTDKPTEAPDADDTATRAEVGRIFANGLRSGDIPPSDRLYLSQLVAARTGLSPEEADKRVNDVYSRARAVAADAEAKAREAADAARKAASYTSLWMFIALLVGAFAATFAATLGGRLRDGVYA